MADVNILDQAIRENEAADFLAVVTGGLFTGPFPPCQSIPSQVAPGQPAQSESWFLGNLVQEKKIDL